MKKKSISNNLMRILTMFGGGIGFLYNFNIYFQSGEWNFPVPEEEISLFIINFFGLLSTSFTLLVAIKPNNPIPWHFGIVGVLGILVIFFCHFWPG